MCYEPDSATAKDFVLHEHKASYKRNLQYVIQGSTRFRGRQDSQLVVSGARRFVVRCTFRHFASKKIHCVAATQRCQECLLDVCAAVIPPVRHSN